MELSQERCIPYQVGTPTLSREDAEQLVKEIPRWTLKDKSIEREFTFKDFRESIDFINEVADVAESQDHHPDMCIYYNKVRIELSTHKIGGLSRNDFVMASKIDRIV
jgi:4a-hydroxytetrahydrobiopterin dehydratase